MFPQFNLVSKSSFFSFNCTKIAHPLNQNNKHEPNNQCKPPILGKLLCTHLHCVFIQHPCWYTYPVGDRVEPRHGAVRDYKFHVVFGISYFNDLFWDFLFKNRTKNHHAGCLSGPRYRNSYYHLR